MTIELNQTDRELMQHALTLGIMALRDLRLPVSRARLEQQIAEFLRLAKLLDDGDAIAIAARAGRW